MLGTPVGRGSLTGPERVSTRHVATVAGAAFFVLGMLAALGPTLPDLARNTGVSRAEAGALFTALFIGGFLSQTVTGALTDKFGHRWVLTGGLLVMGLGFVGVLVSPSLPLAFACMVVAGLGDGVLVVSANVMVAEVFRERSVSALNALNIFFGVGAITGPAFVGASLSIWGTALPVLWVLAALSCLLVPFAATLRIPPHLDTPGEKREPAVGVFVSPVLWLLGLLLLLYVGTEVGVGGWTATYMERATGIVPEAAALVASSFYVALTVGRVLGALLGTRLPSSRVLLLCLVGALVGGALLFLGMGNAPMMIGAIALFGLSLGPIYPTVVGIAAAQFPASQGKAAGLAMTIGSLGGVGLPWLQGVILEGVGTASAALFVAGSALLMLLAFMASQAASARRRQGSLSPEGKRM